MKLRALLALWLCLGSAFADPRTSADYGIALEALGDGGRAASADYVNDGNFSGIIGVSAPVGGGIVNKSGYAGQLYDVVGLAVSAPSDPASVDSGGTVQLTASYLLDDGSFLPVAGPVTWQVVSGPISGIDANGLATGAAVTENTDAVVSGTFGGFTGQLTLTVVGRTQTIDFPPIPTHTVGDAPFALQATASSGLPVTFVVFSGPATLSGSMLTVTGAGEVTVVARCRGFGYLPAPEVSRTFRVIGAQGGFVGLSILGGPAPASAAFGVANGGTVVVGRVVNGFNRAARWTENTFESLGNASASISAAGFGVSADGRIMVGTGDSSGKYTPFLQLAGELPSPLGNLNGLSHGSAQAVSADGSVLAGFSAANTLENEGSPDTSHTTRAFRWTSAGGFQALGSLKSGGASRADGISGDGRIVVGRAESSGGGTSTEAFVWTTTSVMQGLGVLPGATSFDSGALGISADGRTVVGRSQGAAHQQACRWSLDATGTPIGSAVPLGELPNATGSQARAVTADGLIAVGHNTVGGANMAAIWNGTNVRGLQEMLTTDYGLGASLGGWVLTEATAVSPDGFAVAGIGLHNGVTEGFRVIIPRPATIGFSPVIVQCAPGATTAQLQLTKSGGAGDVTFQVVSATAVQVIDGVGDFDAAGASTSSPGATTTTVHFDTTQTSATIDVPLNPSTATLPERSFTVKLLAPGGGQIAVATVILAASNGADPNGPVLSQIATGALPALGDLTVRLLNPAGAPYVAGAVGVVPRWRFAGDTTWHLTGETVSGLTPGEFALEFESVVNFSATPPTFLPAPSVAFAHVDPGTNPPLEIQYPVVTGAPTGGLEVVLTPASVANNAIRQQKGQWRFLGELDSMWRDSGATIPNLPAGSYLLEFKTVPGYAPIRARGVQVEPGVTTGAQALYQLQEQVAGTLPQPVGANTVMTQRPFEFIGQVSSDAGSGSGVAAAERVVLTAAHVIFDDATATYVTGLQWQCAPVPLQFEPTPLVPRGAYLLDGYAAARAGTEAGVGTPASQSLDAAALYFLSSAANSGRSGFLVTNAQNNWLTKARRKLLAGYPIDPSRVTAADLGKMWSTPAQLVAFNPSPQKPDQVYLTTQIAGLAGMSGAPLCVQYDDGSYYPAAIYLGGNQQCVVRVIDSTVQSLLANAVLSSQDDDNHVGGGQIRVSSQLGASSLQFGKVVVNFTTDAAGGLPGGLSWRLAGEATKRPGGSASTVRANTPLQIIFAAATGFVPPAPYGPFRVQPGKTFTIEARYLKLRAPKITTSTLALAGAGLPYTSPIKADFGPKGFNIVSITKPTGELESNIPGLLAALNLTLSNKGILSTPAGGTIPANAPLGTYTFVVTASNSIGVSGARPLDLVISPAAKITVATFLTTQGAVSMNGARLNVAKPETLEKLLPVGSPIALLATPKLPGFTFGGWTRSDQSGPTLGRALNFALPGNVTVTPVFTPNFFLNTAGTFEGLVTREAAGLSAHGFLNLTVTLTGTYTGTLNIGATVYRPRGTFDDTGALRQTVAGPKGTGAAVLDLQLANSNGRRSLKGVITVNGFAFLLDGHQTAASAKVVFPAQKLTMAIPHSTDPVHLDVPTWPQGDGYGTVTISRTGVVSFSGTAGDGTPVVASSKLGRDGEWPFFKLLYKNKGVLTGPLKFHVSSPGTVDGQLSWVKPSDGSALFPNGFDSFDVPSQVSKPLLAQGEQMTAPLANLTAGTFTISGSALAPLPPAFGIGFDSTGKATANDNPNFQMKITLATGLFKGQFLDSSHKTRVFNGVVLPASGKGFGLFKTDDGTTGSVEVSHP